MGIARPAALPPSRYDLTQTELAALLEGEPAYRVGQVWRGLYRRGLDPAAMTDLPLALRERLEEALPAALTPALEQHSDGGETVKGSWSLRDGNRVETVLMGYPDRVTVCISSQAGCGMGCVFCATGQGGLARQLSTGEIVEQVIRARRLAEPRRLGNIVFMGMGEPMANYTRVWGAVERLHRDVGISARKITISTVGLVPGIRKLATEALPVNLAVSLHAANDELRTRLVPPNRRYPLPVLLQACREYVQQSGRRLSFEWALIAGVNDRPSDASELAAAAVPLRAHVNLIPLNPTPGFLARGTPAAGVRAFRERLLSLGVNATIRDNRGTDIHAACGQLAAGTPGRAGPLGRPPRGPAGQAP
ncbi:MAG TPA: 23S rRNA (adenine(2503)-C(2))-methyltransferase RlmN [Actinomycetota bacterium]|nr:23S rRNA (adenine(2503)-C(2))-methyltransferase RlmN [Actinomycetota bacterium]